MGYNLAKEKMKKNLLKGLLMTLIVVGSLFAMATPLNAKGNMESPTEVTSNSEGCISGVFVAEEDGHIVGTITLNSKCTFKLVDRSDGYVTITSGTYSIDGAISRGQMADITFYVDGRSMGTTRIAWPEDEGLCIFMNGYVFRKQ